MPYRRNSNPSMRDQLLVELRLCLLATAGCCLVGGLSHLVNQLASLHTHFPALGIVGAFYGVMALLRWWQWSRTDPCAAAHPTLNH